MSNPKPNCLLCEHEGVLLYPNLSDRLLGAPGTWTMKQCSSPGCDLVWLDPQPTEEDLQTAYRNYYTHREVTPAGSFLERTVFRFCLICMCVYAERERLRRMCLDGIPPGRLLEVGCGSGARLARLRALGWEAHGQEIDPNAAAVASNQYRLPVFLGRLEQAPFADAQFDAVVMNHVIEHVPDPVSLLATCRRLLRPGGTLVVVTPNILSFLHRRFGASWRGLEPPRHLHLFSPVTLTEAAHRAGFVGARCETSAANAFAIAMGSQPHPNRLTGLWLQLRAKIAWTIHRHSGEECVLQANKT